MRGRRAPVSSGPQRNSAVAEGPTRYQLASLAWAGHSGLGSARRCAGDRRRDACWRTYEPNCPHLPLPPRSDGEGQSPRSPGLPRSPAPGPPVAPRAARAAQDRRPPGSGPRATPRSRRCRPRPPRPARPSASGRSRAARRGRPATPPGIAMPITGSVVCEATTPDRCAASPAIAMNTPMPRSAAPPTNRLERSGARWARDHPDLGVDSSSPSTAAARWATSIDRLRR